MSDNFYEIRDMCRRNLVKYTQKAFSLIPAIDAPLILDLGCGTGEPALALLEICNGKIYAVDEDVVCIEVLKAKVKAANLTDKIEVILGSAFDTDRPQQAFDIVLAEGLLNIIGFETGLRILIRSLKSGGYLIIHDEFTNDSEKRALFKKYNLQLLHTFELDEKIWWQEYYACLEASIGNMKDEAFSQEISEINEYKNNPETSRSIFYIAKLLA